MDYLTTFFDEKTIEHTVYNVEAEDGTLNIIETQVIIDRILRSQGAERVQIENIIRQIDFANGDLHHFFEHLARAIAQPLFN